METVKEECSMKLRDYVDAIVRNPGDHHIVLQPQCDPEKRAPHDTMAWVTLMVAQKLWGDLSTWNLNNITFEAWHVLKSKMACTEWQPCIATSQFIPDITDEASKALQGYWLWQNQDLPDDVRPKYLKTIDLLLWCVPKMS